jgi:hypothetical protein
MRVRIPATVFGLAALCAMALTSPIPATAQGTLEQRAACEGDAQRLCGHCIPDIDCITSCMVQRQRLVSAGCRAVMRRGGQAKRARD